MDTLYTALQESAKVTFFVLLMMILVDIINIKTRGKLKSLLQSGNQFKQYVVASMLGTAPGCFGSFAGVSLYIHGMLSIGAITGLMFATAGDEQFIMLAVIPETAVLLFGILFILGIAVGFLTDKIYKKFSLKVCADCAQSEYHPDESGYRHYFTAHIWKHIIKGHAVRIFLWTFGALIVIEYGIQWFHLDSISSEYPLLLLTAAALIGLIPESGPHLLFVMLFSKGLIPFSVLFVSSAVQDGHGMLPMLSYSMKDSLMIKLFNFAFGLIIGLIIYLIGY